MARIALALFACGCGRVAFDAYGDGGGGDSKGSAAIDAPACSTQTAADWLGTPMPRDGARQYAVSADGLTVTDAVTGLRWQRQPTTTTFLRTDAASYCASLTLGGCAQWRAPERIELASIVDHPVVPPLDGAFQGPTDLEYWTATFDAAEGGAWVINFNNGNTYFWASSTMQYYVRCVHSETTARMGDARYSVGANSVTDLDTGLVWTRAIEPATDTLSGATAYCAGLTTDGGGWRLPEIAELETIIDPSADAPAIDAGAFPGTPPAVFWSSSSYNAFAVMVIDFTAGNIVNADPSTMSNARCVR